MKAFNMYKFIFSILILSALVEAQGTPSGGLPNQNVVTPEGEIKDNGTEINVKNADISAIIRIFSARTKRNYILDERVTGKVSIFLPGKVTSEEAIRILDSVLAYKGLTSVPIGENLWKIIKSEEAKQTTIPTIDDIEGRGSAVMVTKLINLNYVPAEDAKALIDPLISPRGGLVNAYTGTNSLIIIDSEENIQRLEQLIASVDVPQGNREMTIIPIEHAEATDIAEKITQILTDDNSEKSSANGVNVDTVRTRLKEANARVAGATDAINSLSTGQAGSTVTSRSSVQPKIIADERTNSLIVVANEDATARIRALASELDSPVNRSGNKFYVYRCQHASSEDIAEVLSGLVGGNVNTAGGSSGSTSSGSRNNDDASGSSARGSLSDQSTRTQNRLARQSRTPGESRNNPTSVGSTSVQFAEDFSVTADPATNSLIISASKSDYEKLMELLKQIDIKRRQVLVEAMILEVTVDSNVDTGMEFITSAGGKDGGILAVNNFGGLTNLLSDPTKVSQLSVAAASSGTLNLPNNISIPTQTVLLTAASRNNNVNVLSSPNILATDNEEAEIVVGQNVPFLASTASSDQNLNNTFNQIDRQDVGITLRITPQINSNDYVNLRMFTEVSNVVGDSAASELGPTTTVRTTETTVITKDGQMVIIGGLISDNQTETENGVPYLKDVPVLGTLFKGLGKKSVKTNLLIFITPRVIKDQFDARDVTKNKSKKIQEDIFDSGIEPDRTDILDNLEMDTVIESEIYTGKKPSTIRAKSKAAEIEIMDSNNSDSNSEEIIVPITQKPTERSAITNSTNINSPSKINNNLNKDINKNATDPKLPKFEAEFDEELMDLEMAPTQPSSKINEPRGTINTKDYPKNSLSGKFIVLQVEGNSIPSDLPFESSSSGLVAINIPQESSQKAKQFFEVGQRYSFSTTVKPLKFKALGSFSNQKEAEDFYTELKKIKWYNLSPHEIFRLGQDPWKRN